MRHTHATLDLKVGVPLYIVSKRLGHNSIEITADVYAKMLPGQDEDVARAVATAVKAAQS